MENRVKFHFDNIYKDPLKEYGPVILYQAGDLSCSGGYIVPLHIQQVYEISYIVSGKGVFTINNQDYPVKKDDILIDTIGDSHSIKSSMEEPLRYFYIGFLININSVPKRYKKIDDFYRNISRRLLSDKTGIRDLYIKLFNELISNDDITGMMIETYLTQIILITFRNYRAFELNEYNPKRIFDTKEQFIYNVVNFIDAKNIGIKSLNELSMEFGYSYSYIEHVFSDVTGESLKEYLIRKKFEKATELLNIGTSVTEVAEDLGYSSIHSFSRAFRKCFGYPPIECRRNR